MNNPDEMKSYYNRRAQEYEKVYQRPERQGDLEKLRKILQSKAKDQRILEVACGTGYWTQDLAATAQFILSTDQSDETLEFAKSKKLPNEKVQFLKDDAYSLQNCQGEFTLGFAGFWWSHVPRSKLSEFLANFHSKLQPNAKVIFCDNGFREGDSTSICRTDLEGNTFQQRTLEDGSSFEVLKNFPTDEEFRRVLQGLGKDLQITRLKFFWILEYTALN